jgi:ferredoxin
MCEGHGLCAELLPEVFDLADDDIVTVTDEQPPRSTRRRCVPLPRHARVKQLR